MLSSLANRFYWIGRNLERTETTARLINVYTELLLDLPTDAGVDWTNLIRIAGAEAGFASERQWPLPTAAVRYLAGSADNDNSIRSCIAVARENMRTVRDVVPREAFEAVNDLHLFAEKRLASSTFRRIRYAVLNEVVARSQRIGGLFASAMTRGFEYEFLSMGRHLERADMTTRILDVAGELLDEANSASQEHQALVWISVLRSASGYQMYRRNVRSRITPIRVLHFLINDVRFPRSVRYCLSELLESFEALPRGGAPRAEVVGLLERMDGTAIKLLATDELHHYLDEFQKSLASVHNVIEHTWFSPFDEPVAGG